MTDRETCERIVIRGNCDMVSCKFCPLAGGDWAYEGDNLNGCYDTAADRALAYLKRIKQQGEHT